MRKYILLLIALLSIGASSAQYNLFARQNFSHKGILTPNTYIGGVSATISTPALLATKLGISVGNISNFTIVGSDIKCRITGSYTLGNVFQSDTNITYYRDTDGLITSFNNTFYLTTKFTGDCVFNGVTSLGSNVFRPTLAKRYILPNCTSITNDNFHQCTNAEIVYIPLATTLGTPSVDNGNFFQIKSGCKIYCHPSLATNNGGAPDADITAAIGFGAVISYVSNFTAPNPITNLSIGTVYSTALQLNFTPPTGSANAIDFYDCYANGEYKNTITGSGQYIVGLNASTSYSITVKPVDILYNQSSSNAVIQSTNTTSAVPTSGLVAYYKLDETSGVIANDSYGTEHLTNTNVAINQIGKIGTSYLSATASNKLTGTVAAITGNFSINIWIYRTANGTSGGYCNIAENGGFGAGGFGIWIDATDNLGYRINNSYENFSSLTQAPLNEWVMYTMTWDGSNIKLYVNSKLKRTIAWTTAPTSATTRTLFSRGAQTYYGKLDENTWYNTAKTQNEIDILYNLGTGITL